MVVSAAVNISAPWVKEALSSDPDETVVVALVDRDTVESGVLDLEALARFLPNNNETNTQTLNTDL